MALVGTSVAATVKKPKRAMSNRRAGNKAPRSPSQKFRRAAVPRLKRAPTHYSKRARTGRTTSVRSGPTPERYKEIQQALAEKGYYKGEVNGEWTADSTDALRRFQSDQNLAADGKLGSLSLIALGLGPKRTASAQAKPQTTPSEPAPTPPPPGPGVPQ